MAGEGCRQQGAAESERGAERWVDCERELRELRWAIRVHRINLCQSTASLLFLRPTTASHRTAAAARQARKMKNGDFSGARLARSSSTVLLRTDTCRRRGVSMHSVGVRM